MDWQQKAAALNQLTAISLHLRKENDWYVRQNVEVKEGCMLASHSGSGSTPEKAIEDHWRYLVTHLPDSNYLVLHGYNRSRRKAVRWNGSMWEDIDEQAYRRKTT